MGTEQRVASSQFAAQSVCIWSSGSMRTWLPTGWTGSHCGTQGGHHYGQLPPQPSMNRLVNACHIRWAPCAFTINHLLHVLVWAVLFSSLVFAQGINSGEPYRFSATLGESVILRCVFDFPDGFRVPYVIQWEKQGVKIPIYIWYEGYPPHVGEGYENRVGLTGQASLNLSSVRETDQGWYECKVFFLNRPPEPIKNGTWVHLDVLAPPQFRLKPPDVIYVKVGESITLPCEATGTPSPQIVWYKDNQPLLSSANFHILPNELRISSIQMQDIGEYRCTSRNREGSITTSTKIIIAGPAVITLPPRNMTKLEGDRVEFICEARALPSNVTHRWFHNGVEISHLLWMENRVTLKQGTLIINPSIAEDSGRYTCEVSNGIGLPETAEAYLNIEYPARVVYSPTIQYLPSGLSGIVRCFIQASPPFQFVTWTKDRRPFDPNSTPGVTTLNNGSLLFNRVSHEHQGIYRCTPYNVHGSSEPSQAMEILVRDPPNFTIKPNEVYVRSVNDEVTMPCDGSGQPKPNIFWRKGDSSKLPRERASLRAGNLTIKLLKKEDHGSYECVLENEIATIVATTSLIVNNTTPHMPDKLFVNASYFAATVHWEPGYNGGYEQTFHLSYRISDQGDAEWKTIRVPPPETTNTFTLYNLQSDTEYEFQVYASNRLGPGLPTQPIRASTKVWSFGEKIYPTDASGATYIPTVQKPSGPKPDSPRNLTLEKMAQGWVLSWLAPQNRTVAVAYYRVEYRQADKSWQYTDPISYETAYLFKDLEPNHRYIFRVWAYSILGVGEVSEMIEVNLSGVEDRTQNARAITAAVVGSVLCLIVLTVLSICMVKLCNKRKRRKIEKSYMMVTCPVNGITSYGDSPVPSKQYSSNGNCLTGQQYDDDQYNRYGNYWQRPATGARIVAGRSSAPLAVHVWPKGSPFRAGASTDVHHDDAYYWRLRDAHRSSQPLWSSSQPTDERPIPPPRRRALKNLQYLIEAKLVPSPFDTKLLPEKSQKRESTQHYDLTPDHQHSARGSFRSDGSGQSQVRRPFSQLSFTGSSAQPPSELEFGSSRFYPVRSSLRPQTLLPYQPRQGTTIYQPQEAIFKTSSPTRAGSGGNIAPFFSRDFSSITRSNTLEPSKHTMDLQKSLLQSQQLRELPSLRPIHEAASGLQVYPGRSSTVQPFFRAVQDNNSMRATVPIGRSISQFGNRALSKLPTLEPVPEAIYDLAPHNVHSRSQRIADSQIQADQQNLYQNLPLHSLSMPIQHLTSRASELSHRHALITTPSLDYQRNIKYEKGTLNSYSSSGSSPEQFEYTRDKLLGAVEKVRSGYLLSRSSPYRHSIEGRSRTPVLRIPIATPVDKMMFREPPSGMQYPSIPESTIQQASVQTVPSQSSPVKLVKPKAKSMKSAKYLMSTCGPASHHRPASGSSSQVLLDPSSSGTTQLTPIESSSHSFSRFHDPSSGSSGFVSGTMSSLMLQQPSISSGSTISVERTIPSSRNVAAAISPLSISEKDSVLEYPQVQTILRPRSQPFSSTRDPYVRPFNTSTGEEDELEVVSRMDAELAKLRRDQLRWRHWQTWQRDRNLMGRQRQIEELQPKTTNVPKRGPMSDTGVYGAAFPQPRPLLYHSYRAPRDMTISDIETRCAALREEFLNFRRRQIEENLQRQQVEQFLTTEQQIANSSSSDEFESAC